MLYINAQLNTSVRFIYYYSLINARNTKKTNSSSNEPMNRKVDIKPIIQPIDRITREKEKALGNVTLELEVRKKEREKEKEIREAGGNTA